MVDDEGADPIVRAVGHALGLCLASIGTQERLTQVHRDDAAATAHERREGVDARVDGGRRETTYGERA